MTTTIVYTIDAQNKKLGRVSSEAASILMGKNTPAYARNKAPSIKVNIINASKADIIDSKKQQMRYATYSGYPGGLKQEKLSDLLVRRGYSEAFKRAIAGMLPKNRLKAAMMRNLTITE